MFDEAVCKDCGSQRYSGAVLTRYVYRCLTDNVLGKFQMDAVFSEDTMFGRGSIDGRSQSTEL